MYVLDPLLFCKIKFFGLSGPVVVSRPFSRFFTLSMNRRRYEVTRNNFVILLYFATSISSVKLGTNLLPNGGCSHGFCQFSSKLSTFAWQGCDGQWSLDSDRNSGPFHHSLLVANSVDAMCAGFCFVGTYFHNSGGATYLISINRFSTNCLNSLFVLLIQLNTTVESDQYVTESIPFVSFNAFITLSVNRIAKRLDGSSSRGMVCFNIGATLVFEAMSTL